MGFEGKGRLHQRALPFENAKLDSSDPSSLRWVSAIFSRDKKAAMLRALLSLTILQGSLAEVPADEIKSLPGWSGPLPSRMWSGHIDGGSDVQDGVVLSMKMWYMSVFARLPPLNTGVRPTRSPQTRTLTPIPKRRTNPNQTGTWSARRARTPRRRPPCCGRMGAPARPQPTACSQNLGHSRCRTSLCAPPL